MSQVLVCGAGGQLGQELVATCPAHWQIIPMTRSMLDIADSDQVARALDEVRPAWVINAAAFTAVDAAESEPLARSSDPNSQVYLVPAFTGLGAPYWDADARGAIFGLTRGTGIAEIVNAALMSVCFQTKDLLLAMEKDGAKLNELRVDGGMVANDFFAQKLADMLNCAVLRPVVIETTALGAAYAAGLQAGLYESTEAIAQQWQLDTEFLPECDSQWRELQYCGWIDAIHRTRSNLFDTESQH